ncbi:hypothetical protein SMICM17S_08914 [Streptomyces microflavus]
MRIATTIFLTDETVTPVRLARELEQRGFAGLYLPEHTHIPVTVERSGVVDAVTGSPSVRRR